MDDVKPTWAVVATVDEPPALVQAFVAWHLSVGASAIFLYFDRSDDPAADMFGHLPQVDITRCDAPYWKDDRPGRHEVRQVKNAQDAYARASTDWIAHIDADEFLWASGSIAAALPRDGQTACITIPVAERVYVGGAAGRSIFSGAFRRPFRAPADIGREVFGPDYDLTNLGLTGHAQGKAFSRIGRDLRLSIHRPKAPRGTELQISHADPAQFELLHFEGLTPAHWVFKLKRMADALAHHDGMPPSKHRARQIAALRDNPDGADALHDRLKLNTPSDAKGLFDHGLLVTPDFDPTDALAIYFPDATIDLTEASIDQWIAKNKAAVLRYLADQPPNAR